MLRADGAAPVAEACSKRVSKTAGVRGELHINPIIRFSVFWEGEAPAEPNGAVAALILDIGCSVLGVVY